MVVEAAAPAPCPWKHRAVPSHERLQPMMRKRERGGGFVWFSSSPQHVFLSVMRRSACLAVTLTHCHHHHHHHPYLHHHHRLLLFDLLLVFFISFLFFFFFFDLRQVWRRSQPEFRALRGADRPPTCQSGPPAPPQSRR